ncbi:hypothetical protein COP1_022328 [Malus domestica]
MSSFPTELVVNILLRLLPEDLIPSMCVSKAWSAFMGDQSFFKSHHQRSIQTISTRTILLHLSDLVSFYLPLGDNEMLGSSVKIAHPGEYQKFETPVDEDDNFEYGVIESWTPFYSNEHETMPWWLGYCKPLVFTKNGEMVLLKKDYLVWLDLEGKNGNRVEIGGLPLTFEAIICIGSLSLLDGDPVIVGRQL